MSKTRFNQNQQEWENKSKHSSLKIESLRSDKKFTKPTNSCLWPKSNRWRKHRKWSQRTCLKNPTIKIALMANTSRWFQLMTSMRVTTENTRERWDEFLATTTPTWRNQTGGSLPGAKRWSRSQEVPVDGKPCATGLLPWSHAWRSRLRTGTLAVPSWLSRREPLN